MAKIDRYNGNLAAFASQADTNRRTTFGTETTGDDTLDGNLNADFFTGWQIVGPNEFPTLEDFNAALFTIGQLMAYVHQVGMPEWNGAQEYHIGSKVNRAGVEYICTTNSHVSVTPPESDAANWRLPAAADIGYDNASSGLTAETTQAAIDESFDKQIGQGQTWQNLLASRSLGVTYTNSTGRPIFVAVRITDISDSDEIELEVGGVRADSFGVSAGAQGNRSVTVSGIVPDGTTYIARQLAGSVTLQDWSELR